jgi:protein MpaA
MFVERQETGILRHSSSFYGTSREGIPLRVWLPEDRAPEILILAAIHGDEPETTVVVSDALRAIDRGGLKNAAILCGNPDGLLRGTRGNAVGVDLNRNLPTSNWSPEPVRYKSRREGPRDIALSPGAEPASEPETRALISLIDEMKPRAVVSLHGALACIDDEGGSKLGRWIAERSGLPLEEVGYPTPGSFGSWAREHELTLVTYELEAASLYDLKERHSPVLIELLTGAMEIGD